MARSQISFDPETQRRARKRASELGISFARYVRVLVAHDLATQDRQADPAAVFDLGTSGAADIARDKDTLVGAAVAAQRELHE